MRRNTLGTILALALLGATASSALGQGFGPKKEEKLLPPAIQGKNDDSQIWGITGSVVFLIVTLVATLVPPKRGHQD